MPDVRDLTCGSRRARLWQGTLPALTYPVVQVLERGRSARSCMTKQVREVAIEWSRPTCGPSSYGLLGAQWTPQGTARLLVRVLVSADVPVPGPDWRPLTSPSPQPGLSKEYAEPVLMAALEAEELADLGAGILCYSHAAHDLVGSSPVVFKWLAQAVVRVLTREGPLPADDHLMRWLHLQTSPWLNPAG
jgi:hypothetical protein